MKCMYCQGEMARGIAPFHIDRKDVHLSLDNIPAWVCSQCGEGYFEEAEVNAVQEIIKAPDEQTEKLVRTA
jgi:YgiT-type zinc finger domain-containing protein